MLDKKKGRNMTDKEIMHHRFSRKNLRKHISILARELGIDKQEYKAACERAMKQEAEERKKGKHEKKIQSICL